MDDNHVSAATLLDNIDLARDDPKIIQTISSILKAPDYHQLFSTFRGDDGQPPSEKAVKFVNALDKACALSPPCLVFHAELIIYLQALGYGDGVPEAKGRLRRALRKTCAEIGILPESYYLDANQIKKFNEVPFAAGGYSDVWRGSYKGENVAIKALRVYMTHNIKALTKVLNTFRSDDLDDC